ncbi:MAG: YggT family protein, partial [Haemophilus sp.]|nr:YggT family protein [Haemophilus sp.]
GSLLSRAIVFNSAGTDAPLRKVFPTVKKVETAALFLVFLLCGLKSILFGGLNLNFFLLLGILGLIKNIGVAIFYVLIASAILSWFNRGNNPAFYALYQLTEPLLKPIKRILPTIGMIDFSPMVIAIILLFLNNLFYDYFKLLWAIAA